MSELFDREALTYRSREKIKAMKYQKGMENGYILRFYKSNVTVLSGAIICTTLEQAKEESKKPIREKFCLDAENQRIPVVYNEPVPIIITHKHTDEEKELLSEAGYLPFTPFLDDNENDYVYEEITEEDCWIVKNLLNGGITVQSEEFMQEYELLEDKEDLQMFTVDNKFEVGQEVYLLTKTKERLENKCTCDVCMGRGKVTYKGYDVKCPKCKGKGDIILNSKVVEINTVDPESYRIVSYRYTVCKDGEILRYKIKQEKDHFSKNIEKSVTEEEIFAMREEAVKVCDELNMFDRYDEWGKQLLEQLDKIRKNERCD